MGHHLRVRTIGLGAGSSPGVTSTTDPFTTGHTGDAMAGPQYFANVSVGNGTAGVDIDAQLNWSGAGMVFGSGSGVNNNSMRITFYPSAVDWNEVLLQASRGFFVQWTLVSRTAGIDAAWGGVAMGRSGTDTGYQFLIRSEAPNLEINMGLGSAVTYQVRAAAFAPIANDIIRIEVRPSAASNEIKTFQNGVLRSTDVDANAARPTVAASCVLWGWGCYGVFTGVLVCKDFSAGLL